MLGFGIFFILTEGAVDFKEFPLEAKGNLKEFPLKSKGNLKGTPLGI